MARAPGAPLLLRADRTPLVGRAQQRALLEERLAEARAGHPGVVLLAGPPGIGKTRLLEEFAASASRQGVTVLRGIASQAEGMPPYLPFLEALGEHAASVSPEVLREQLGPHAGTLVTLLPEIPARLGPIEPVHPLGHQQERFRLYEAVAAFLASIAETNPLVLLFDDLQWVDASTCDLLVHVARRVRSAPLLLVGTYREGESLDNPAFTGALAELNRQRVSIELLLQPLEAEESRVLAGNLLGGEVAPAAAELLQRRTEGNPFFLEELIRLLVEDGTLRREGGRWALGSEPGPVLPPRAAEAVRMRLARLEPGVVELLRVAAVVGRTWEAALLARVAQRDVEEIEEAVATAVQSRLVQTDSSGWFTFTHDMVRETLYADVGRTRRQRLHQAIGEALEAEGNAHPSRRLPDLAFHFAESGSDRSRAVAYALAAAEQALAASAAMEAMAHFRTALRLLDSEDPDRQTAMTGLGQAAMLAGEYETAADAYAAARDAWLKSGERTLAAQAWSRLAEARWRQERVEEARDGFTQAIELLGPEDSAGAAEVLLHLADLSVTSLGRYPEGVACAQRALAMVERLGDLRLEAKAWCVTGNIEARRGDAAGGIDALERSLALAQGLDDPALAAEACAYLANVTGWIGDFSRSYELSLQRLELAGRTHDPFELRHVYAWVGSMEMIRGQWEEAERWFAQQEQAIAGLQNPEPHAFLRANQATVHYYLGRFEEAERGHREAVAMLRPLDPGALIWYLGRLGLTLAELRPAEALACLAELQDLGDRLDEGSSAALATFAYLAVGYAKLGAQERSAACYPKLLPFRGWFAPLPADRALGLAARAAGNLDAARAHLAEAETRTRAAGMRPELALVLLERGLLERAAEGNRRSGARGGLGRELIAEGIGLCSELGMEELGRRTLSGAVTPERQDGARLHPAGLTNRELEVLRLVAQGRTNREIAETLFLSEHTVARHLTHIFTKAGVENRAGAAAFALRHELT